MTERWEKMKVIKKKNKYFIFEKYQIPEKEKFTNSPIEMIALMIVAWIPIINIILFIFFITHHYSIRKPILREIKVKQDGKK